ncbi:MAG: insulinase family protein [Anaeromyxobacteraceae bacterium]
MRLRPLLAVALVATGCAASLPKQYKVRPFPYQGFTANYPTGMRLVAFQLQHMPEMMLSASYRVGSVDDPKGRAGLAHLVEHLTYRARPGGGPRTWDRYEAMGIEFNALTYADSTDYVAVFPPSELQKVLALEAARLAEPLAGITERDFQAERQVVLRELAMRRDPAAATTHLGWLTSRLVPESPYAVEPTEDSVASLTLQDARDFVRSHYTPDRLLLVVTGPTQGEAVSRAAVQHFGELATSGPKYPEANSVQPNPPRVALDKPATEKVLVREGPAELPLLWVGWALPGDKEKAGPQALVAEQFLEGMVGWISSHRGNRGKIRGITTYANRMDGVTIVAARIELHDAEDGPKIFEAIRDGRDFRGGVSGVEPWEAPGLRTQLLMNAHLSLDALEQLGMARFIRVSGQPDYIGEWPKQVALALSDDEGMRSYFKKYATSERLAGLLVVPADTASPVPTTRVAGATGMLAADHHGHPPEELTPGNPLDIPRVPELANVTRKKLPNGVDLVVAPRSGFRAVSAGFYARTPPGGPADEYLRWMALWATQCAAPDVDDAAVSFRMRQPTDLAAERLHRFPCLDVGPKPNAPELAQGRRFVGDQLEQFPPSARERASAAFLSALYPDHPYGDTLITAARVRGFGDGEASDFIRGAIRPERTTVVVSGDVETTPDAMEALESRFGGWTAGGTALPTAAPRPALPAARRVLVANRTGWTTAELLVGVRAPPRAERDEPASARSRGSSRRSSTTGCGSRAATPIA